jgi:hypothetical protein
MIKRLKKQNDKYIPNIGDIVIFKNHPYDHLSYTITQILPDGSVFMENDQNAYTNIKPSTIKPLLF